MKISASLFLLVSTASAVPQFGIFGDLLGLNSDSYTRDERALESHRDENCNYYCSDKADGSCGVNYIGRPRAGPSAGSCFSERAGGSCSGTPPECSHCNRVLACPQPVVEDERRPRVNPGGEVCDYNCEDNGSCTVQYVGPPRSGNSAGSCFPESFGGKCSGTPSECHDCNRVLNCPDPDLKQESRRPKIIVDSPPLPRPDGTSDSATPSPPRHLKPELSVTSVGECQYTCKGWPHEQCEMKRSGRFGGFASATCVNPYFEIGSTRKFSNYPECGDIPSGCQRCDDYCARLEGRLDRFSY